MHRLCFDNKRYNDGQVDSADALLILRNSVGLETFDDTQRFLGDVN